MSKVLFVMVSVFVWLAGALGVAYLSNTVFETQDAALLGATGGGLAWGWIIGSVIGGLWVDYFD